MHNLSKISLLEKYNAIYKHYLLCISEIYFDSSVLKRDKNIQLIGYNIIFYMETLGACVVNLTNLSEHIISEISIQYNKGYIGVVYRSPSQDAIEFQNFLSSFGTDLSDSTINNALFTIILGGFNATSSV